MLSLSNLEEMLNKLATHTADQRIVVCENAQVARRIQKATSNLNWKPCPPQVHTSQQVIRQTKQGILETMA